MEAGFCSLYQEIYYFEVRYIEVWVYIVLRKSNLGGEKRKIYLTMYSITSLSWLYIFSLPKISLHSIPLRKCSNNYLDFITSKNIKWKKSKWNFPSIALQNLHGILFLVQIKKKHFHHIHYSTRKRNLIVISQWTVL